MPNIAQAKKREKQNIKINARNRSLRSEMRTLIKQFLAEISSNNKEQAASIFKKSVKRLQQFASKNIIKKNKAARITSRLNKKLKAISV